MAQRRIVGGRIADPVLLPRDVVAAVLVQFERQGRLPGSGQGRASYVSLPCGTTGRLRATRCQIWVSDRYAAQQGHGLAQQTCLAHLARDVAYALEGSDDPMPFRLKLWLASAFALADSVSQLAASTVAAKRRALERRLSAILAAPTTCDLAAALQAKLRRARDQLLTFANWGGTVEASRVEDRRGSVRRSGGGSRRCLPTAFSVRTDLTPFPVPARQTGHADLPHPAFSRSVKPSLSAGRRVAVGRGKGQASRRDARPGSGRTRYLVVPCGASTSDGPAAPCICG